MVAKGGGGTAGNEARLGKSEGLGALAQTGGEARVTLAFNSSITTFREDSSLDRVFTYILRANNSEDWDTNLQWGHRKGSGEEVVAWKAACDSPAHPRCCHALHVPSHSIESWVPSTIGSSHIGQITLADALGRFCFLDCLDSFWLALGALEAIVVEE